MEEDNVRAVLVQWHEGIRDRDLEKVLAAYSPAYHLAGHPEGRGHVQRMFERAFSQLEMVALEADISGAEISMREGLAHAEPVRLTHSRASRAERLVFQREAEGWRIVAQETLHEGPIEGGLPGLGDVYVELLERWARANLQWIHRTLEEHPPNGGNRIARRHALAALDEPLHLRSAPQLEAVGRFLRERIDRALTQMRSEAVREGASVWKLYNHGWVVRTARHGWGFDISPGVGKTAMADEQIDGLLDQVEVLSCSHRHGDHTDPRVIARAVEKGIPVLVPPPAEESSPEIDGATVIEPGARGTVRGMSYHAYPGHQDALANNVFLVSMDGTTLMQTGDQHNREDFAWIDAVAEECAVDVLLPNVWTLDLPRMLAGVRPRLVVPGHENELGHLFEHREPYDQAFEKLAGAECEWHVMTWGERVHVEPR